VAAVVQMQPMTLVAVAVAAIPKKRLLPWEARMLSVLVREVQEIRAMVPALQAVPVISAVLPHLRAVLVVLARIVAVREALAVVVQVVM
jgi:ribosome-associated toxin RatA of RatAB toxin-antitoxin module